MQTVGQKNYHNEFSGRGRVCTYISSENDIRYSYHFLQITMLTGFFIKLPDLFDASVFFDMLSISGSVIFIWMICVIFDQPLFAIILKYFIRQDYDRMAPDETNPIAVTDYPRYSIFYLLYIRLVVFADIAMRGQLLSRYLDMT